jgi:hypothetical protein
MPRKSSLRVSHRWPIVTLSLILISGANHNQNGFVRALDFNMSNDEYHELLKSSRNTAGRNGIDKTLEENDVDVIMGPDDGLLFSISGTAGQWLDVNESLGIS